MITFDIETGPLPLPQIEPFLPPFDGEVGDFDPAAVKLGNLKDADKIREKIAAAAAAHAASKANVGAARAAHLAKFVERAALSPITGQVLAIGLRADSGDKPTAIAAQSPLVNEGEVIDWFWRELMRRADSSPFVGHNIYGFDLPFLVRRSWLLEIDIPDFVRSGRYWSPMFVDLMDVWGCGSRELVSLDTLSKACGFAGKPEGVNGGDFARLFETDKEAAIAYLENDLEITHQVALKMRVA